MAEYIDREEIKRQLRIWVQDCEDWLENKEANCFRDCIDLIDQFPAADVVEVVRCKDCKHAIIVDDVFPEDEVACSLLSQDVECNNYCMYGEKGEQRHIGKEEDPYEVSEKMDKEE